MNLKKKQYKYRERLFSDEFTYYQISDKIVYTKKIVDFFFYEKQKTTILYKINNNVLNHDHLEQQNPK